MMAWPKTLSVVVIGRNEGARLERCLRSVVAMERGGWELEIVYADSGSTDGSVALAEGLGAKVLALRPVRPTAALGRNAGWRAAGGEVVLFLDGDTVLDPRFVIETLPAFAEERLAVAWGHRREIAPGDSVYNRVLDLDWVYAPGYTPFCGGDALFRRSALEEAGGYDETLIAGEEPELCRRLLGSGYRILHVDRPMTGHDLAMTRFGQYWRRAVRAGHAYAEVAARFRATGEPFWTEEVKRNRVRAAVLCGLPLVGLFLSLGLRSCWPFVVVVAMLTVLVVRTAWKARWKGGRWSTLLLYGLHSHLQQVPIALGQMRFARDQREGRGSALLEYKA